MGMVVVAPFAANADVAPVTTIISTLRRTSSAASSGRRSDFCSAYRYSMVKFFPSISQARAAPGGTRPREPPDRNQCLPPENLCGRLSLSLARRRGSKAPKSNSDESKTQCFLFMIPPNPKSAIENPKLLDDLVRSRQHVRRNGHTDLLRGLQVDHELELGRRFYGQVGRLCAFEDLIHV